MQIIFLALKSSELVSLQLQKDEFLFKVHQKIQNFTPVSTTKHYCWQKDYSILLPSVSNIKQVNYNQEKVELSNQDQILAYCQSQNKPEYFKVMRNLSELMINITRQQLSLPIRLQFVKTNSTTNTTGMFFSDINLVKLWPTTQSDLLIFVEEDHPSCLVTTQKQKEGKSMFNLFDFTESGEQLGRRYLKEMISKPSADKNEIIKRQASTKLLQQIVEKTGLRFVREIQAQIKKYHSFEGIVRQMAHHNNRLTCKNWIQLFNNLKCAIQLSQLLQSHITTKAEDNIPLVQALKALDVDGITEAIAIISYTLDLSNNEKVVVRQGMSQELENLKLSFSKMEDEMINSVTQEIQPLLQNNNNLLSSSASVLMTAIPNIGCFLIMPKQSIQQLKPEFFAQSLGWEYCFEKLTNQGHLLYFKNEITQEFEHKYGDLESQIQEQEFILFQLIEQQVLQRSLHTRIDRFISILDGHLSLVCASESFNLFFPTFDEKLEVRAARDLIHTFNENINPFYPVDFRTTQAVLEGSGKTTNLRMLAQLVYLNQCGCPLPVESASMLIFDEILTYFTHSENFDQQLSVFYTHVDSVMSILEVFTTRAKGKSGVFFCIDNLGQNTSALNAISLNLTFIEILCGHITKNDIVLVTPCLPIDQSHLPRLYCENAPVQFTVGKSSDVYLSERITQIKKSDLNIKPLFVLEQVLQLHLKEVINQLVK